MNDDVVVVLLKEHVDRGTKYPVGWRLTLPQRTAVWLVENGIAKLTSGNTNTKTKIAVARPAVRGSSCCGGGWK